LKLLLLPGNNPSLLEHHALLYDRLIACGIGRSNTEKHIL
jgi:hypothetical protein